MRSLFALAILSRRVEGWQPARVHRCLVPRLASQAPGSASSLISDPCWRAEGLQCIDDENDELLGVLNKLRQEPFFRYYSVDLLKGCSYFPQEIEECTQTCEIYPVDDEDVPLNIRAIDAAQYQFELDAWVRWDMPSEDYYDLWHVPEQFTGYDGSEIWRFIHQKICFPKENYSQKLGTEEGAVWQRDFNRAVSGLHSSISAHIVQGMKSEEGGASGGGGGGAAAANYAAAAASSAAAAARADLSSFPQAEYERRLSRSGENPQALDHLYFAYMLCLCGVREAGERFDFGQDNDSLLGAEGRRLVAQVLRSPLLNDRGILVAQSNLRSHAVETGGNLWQARLRTRDLIKVMDCAQCNVCQLHGKVGALGVATAMQILLGAEGVGESYEPTRVEIAALVTTLGKFASAVKIVMEFEASRVTRVI